MINDLITEIVRHSRPQQRHRNRIAQFLLVMNLLLHQSYFDDGVADYALALLQLTADPDGNSNSYIKLSTRKFIRSNLIHLRQVIHTILRQKDDVSKDDDPLPPELLSIYQQLKPTYPMFDVSGHFREDACVELAAIGIRTIYRCPGRAVIKVCGEMSEKEFNERFDTLTFADPIWPFISFERVI